MMLIAVLEEGGAESLVEFRLRFTVSGELSNNS